LLPGCDKSPPCDELIAHYDEALRRARNLEHWHASRGTAGHNPSTAVHLLTEFLRTLGQEEQLSAIRRSLKQGD
jgi:hypothetical protein